ncbi:MAG: efflux transporter periplasmic adaptor subunit [Nitrosomonadales bacterium SCN 54-20]|nr:MAG: efflux transporter periplasmic adaptor subunit [Nitrosomonadales bacterium SCN 54-20]
MKLAVKSIAFIALAAVFLAAGYWLGATPPSTPAVNSSNMVSVDGKPETKILYYRNPMGLPNTSPIPKKDPMGMDYIPVYEGEEPTSADAPVKISIDRIQKLGVRTEQVGMRALTRTVRAVATVQADERRLHIVAPRFEGWIERLHVNTTGQAVRKGEPLMDVYSPDLIAAQHEYLIARRGTKDVEDGGLEAQAGMERLTESALQRLRNWNISEVDLKTLRQEGHIRQYPTLRSPVNGIVLDKSVIQGQRFMAGETLYRIADLSRVWMLADVFEQDLAMIHTGQSATIQVEAYPDKVFTGEVRFIYPTVNPETRTARVRIELPNPQELLKPAMYGKVEFVSIQRKDKVLAVPESAVLDAGTRQSVLVDIGEGRFEPRLVKLGKRANGYVEVLDGLKAGEMAVVKANFLIDAESNLRAALEGFGHTNGLMPSEPGQKQETLSVQAGKTIHHGEGSIEAIDVVNATVTLAHGPIASLGWPAMVMDFKAQDRTLLQALKPGQEIAFEIAEALPGEYVIVRIQPQDSAAAARQRKKH